MTSNTKPFSKVFALLSDLLGDSFGPDNWTSEARGIVEGLTPFEGDSLGDFTYDDHDGSLTKTWYEGDPEALEAWAGRSPTYHIEVKSTAGTAQEPFQMSRHQLDIVSIPCYCRYNGEILIDPLGFESC